MTHPAVAADQRFNGVFIGLVTDVNDPAKVGRVKIKLPWYARGFEEWARVSQIYAGRGYGSTWIPEVDTEVLVAFAHGDMRWPYVVGCLHGKVDTPPTSRTKSSDVRTLLTPSGSELKFDETNKVIELRTKKGARVLLEEKSGAITLEATKTLTLKAPEISIEGSKKVKVSGKEITLN